MNVRFSGEAQAAIREAKAYVRKRRRKLATEFVVEIRRLVSLLETYPEIGQLRGDIRIVLMRGFPYALTYAVTDGVVYVLALLHQASERYSHLIDHDR